jgi:hypothetical protein
MDKHKTTSVIKQNKHCLQNTCTREIVGKNAKTSTGKQFFTIIYISCLIICASLKEIRGIVNEELMPQDLGDIPTDVRTDR